MHDLDTIGNIVACLLGCFSLIVWTYFGIRLFKQQELVPFRDRDEIAWPPMAVFGALASSFYGPLIAFTLLQVDFKPTPQTVAAICLGLALQIGCAIGCLSLAGPLVPGSLGLFRKGALTDAGYGVMGFLASLVPVLLVSLLVNQLGLRADDAEHIMFKVLKLHPGLTSVSLVAVSVVLLAPMAEELIYRVILQGWMETRIAPQQAIVVSATLFSAMHFGPGRPDYIPLFPLAIILGYLYYRRHSYLAVVVLHGLFNAANLLLALSTGE